MSSEYEIIRHPSSSDAQLPADHWTKITQLPYFLSIRREQAEELLAHTENKYILRVCNDPSELIHNRPNPDVFVISYPWRFVVDQPGEPEIRILHSKIRRRPHRGLYFGDHHDSDEEEFYPTVTELLQSTALARLQPLLN